MRHLEPVTHIWSSYQTHQIFTFYHVQLFIGHRALNIWSPLWPTSLMICWQGCSKSVYQFGSCNLYKHQVIRSSFVKFAFDFGRIFRKFSYFLRNIIIGCRCAAVSPFSAGFLMSRSAAKEVDWWQVRGRSHVPALVRKLSNGLVVGESSWNRISIRRRAAIRAPLDPNWPVIG